MTTFPSAEGRDIPHLISLHVQNFKALADFDLGDLTPLTVLIGPNGSGKSTVFEVLEFLADCFREGLPSAWRKRGGMNGLRTRGEDGPIVIRLTYREKTTGPLLEYSVAIDELADSPVIRAEQLSVQDPGNLGFPETLGIAISRNGRRADVGVEYPIPDFGELREFEVAEDSTLIAAVLGQLSTYPHITALRDMVLKWHVSRFSLQDARSETDLSAHDRLAPNGSNLANVVWWLQAHAPERLQAIVATMRRDVPSLGSVFAHARPGDKLGLAIGDSPFDEHFSARHVSDGTLTLLAHLVLLLGGQASTLVCLDEPENNLHPRIHPDLAESCRLASERSQVIVTTHSPEFLAGINPEELRILYRDEVGLAHTVRCSDLAIVTAQVAEGASLSRLWMEGFFGLGDPLTRGGRPSIGALATPNEGR